MDIDTPEEDDSPAEETPFVEAPELPPPEEEPAPQPPKPESRLAKILRTVLIGLAVLLVIFGLGAMTAFLIIYQPAAAELDRAQGELSQADERISQLEQEINRLSALENENQALREEIDSTYLQVAILGARADVLAARLALADENPSAARLALNKTDDRLQTLLNLVDADHRGVVTDMQSRLRLANNALERDPYAAESDLDVLTMNLVQLENSYFAAP